MKIKFLGAHNTESKNTRLVSFIIDDMIAVDAGSLASELTFSEQKKIIAILLTHGHYDHVKEVPSFAFSNSDRTTEIYALPHTIDILTSHLFDGIIYPKLNEKTPFFKNKPLDLINIKPNKQINVKGYKIMPFAVNHTIDSVGFEIIAKNGEKLFYSGDTGPGISNIWKHISPHFIIMDTTFPNRLKNTAIDSAHLCPSLLKTELLEFKKIKKYFPKVVISHITPKYEEETKKEIENIKKELEISIELAYEGKQFYIK